MSSPGAGDGDVDSYDTTPIESEELRRLLTRALAVLGEDAFAFILSRLDKAGMDLENASTSYSLYQLDLKLAGLLGKEGTSWIMSRVSR